MNTFVLDGSVALSWCFQDEGGEDSLFALNELETGQAFVPGIWSYEICNALLVAERRKRIKPMASARFLEFVKKLPIHVQRDFWPEAEVLKLARANQLSAYDAAYLALAVQIGCGLATLDRALAAAALKFKVPLVRPLSKL